MGDGEEVAPTHRSALVNGLKHLVFVGLRGGVWRCTVYVLYGCTVYELYELYGRTQVA